MAGASPPFKVSVCVTVENDSGELTTLDIAWPRITTLASLMRLQHALAEGIIWNTLALGDEDAGGGGGDGDPVPQAAAAGPVRRARR